MEPTADQREDYLKKLDSVTNKIPRFVGTARRFQDEMQIDNMSDFVLGMIYQNYFEKSKEYSVKYVKQHAGTSTDVNLMDLARIVIDVFQTEAKSVKELIEKELSKN